MGLGLDDIILESDSVAHWKALILLDSHMYSAYEYSIIFKFICFLYPPQIEPETKQSTSLGFAEPQLAPVSEESGAYEPQVGELLEGSCWLGRSFGKGERLLVHDG